MRNASSVKDRLKNYAKKSGRTVQNALTVYILERGSLPDFCFQIRR